MDLATRVASRFVQSLDTPEDAARIAGSLLRVVRSEAKKVLRQVPDVQANGSLDRKELSVLSDFERAVGTFWKDLPSLAKAYIEQQPGSQKNIREYIALKRGTLQLAISTYMFDPPNPSMSLHDVVGRLVEIVEDWTILLEQRVE
jgi:hypothetical protein